LGTSIGILVIGPWRGETKVGGQRAPRLNTLEGNPREMRSAVVNELHGVNPVQPQYDFPNLRGRLGREGRRRGKEEIGNPG